MTPPASGSFTLLEQLTELGEPLGLTLIKGCEKGYRQTARGKDAENEAWGRGCLSPGASAPAELGGPSYYTDEFTCTDLQTTYHQDVYGDFLTQAWSITNSVSSPSLLPGEARRRRLKLLSFQSRSGLSGD